MLVSNLGGSPVTADETAVQMTYHEEFIVVKLLDKESARVLKQLLTEEGVEFLRKFRKAMALLVHTTV